MKMFVDAADISIAPHIILDGVWEEWTEAVLRRVVEPGMTVVEVGANVGYFTLVLAQGAGPHGRVLALEADQALAAIARDNVELNGLQRHCTVRWAAAGDRPGEATFYRAPRQRGNGTLLENFEQLEHNPEAGREAVIVPMTTLDELVQSGTMPDVVKIDAEGAESMVLAGAAALLASRKPLSIVLEFFPRFIAAAGDAPERFLDRLGAAGFAFHRIDERRRKAVAVARDALLAMESAELLLVRR